MRSNNKNIQRVLIGAIAVRFDFVVCIEEHGGRRESERARAREHKRKQRPGERALFRESWLWSWAIVSCSPESNRAAAVIAAGSLEERSITISLSVTFARRRYCRFRGKNRVGVWKCSRVNGRAGVFSEWFWAVFFVFATWFNSFFFVARIPGARGCDDFSSVQRGFFAADLQLIDGDDGFWGMEE